MRHLSIAVLIALVANTAWAADDHATIFTYLEVEQLEYRLARGGKTIHWDAQGWIGDDHHKAWLKTEGEHPRRGKLERAELQLLYGRPIAEFWDLQIGVRRDFRPAPERSFAVIGFQGLAPHFFEIDASAYLSDRGEASARVKAEYDVLLTQQLVLQPQGEINLALQDVPERHVGSGVNNVELGLRLRYEVTRKFAPYVGVNWERRLGEAADFARAEGEKIDTRSVVVGTRFWF
jgi:copper resistance protein B